jgi:small-conductance mechanosensitive channel
VLTKPVLNYPSDGYYRLDFALGIGYEDDINSVKAIISDILNNTESVLEDKDHETFIIEDELASSNVNLKVFFWVHTRDYRVAALVLRVRLIKRVIEVLIKA